MPDGFLAVRHFVFLRELSSAALISAVDRIFRRTKYQACSMDGLA